MIEWLVTDSIEIVNVATPPLSVPVPIVVLPSLNVTVPVGVLAEPECLEALLAHFAAHDQDGACCRSIGISTNAIARMEERLFDEGFRTWSREGHWCKVIMRGFAVRRSVYLADGGFEHAYGRFAEFALAATMHRRGRRLGFATGAAVSMSE